MLSHLSDFDVKGSILPWAPVAFLAITCLVIFRRIYRALFAPLSDVPGPFWARFTRLWELAALHRGNYEQTNIELHEKYGHVVRLAPNRFSISDPAAMKTIFGHGTAFSKSSFYVPFGETNRRGLFTEPSNAAHAGLRRHISMLYSTSTLVSYEQFINNCNALLVSKFRQFSRAEKKISMRSFLQYYAFDVIGEITVGESFGLMENEGDTKGIINAIDESISYGSYAGLFPWIHSWVGLLGNLPGFEPSVNIVVAFVNNRIKAREKGGSGRTDDFVDKLLSLEESGKNTRHDTFNACAQNIAAGSDTTAIALSSAVYNLAKNADVLARLREELETAQSSGQASDPITFKEAQKLPYLQAVILEALRIHPAVGQPMTRVVPSGGAMISGFYFPAGAEVGVNPWVVHRNKDIFGKDADEFRPERWLDPTQRSKLDQNFIAFGAGARTCIGKNISLLELSKVIPELVRKFDFELVSPGNDWATKTRWFVKPTFECWIRERA